MSLKLYCGILAIMHYKTMNVLRNSCLFCKISPDLNRNRKSHSQSYNEKSMIKKRFHHYHPLGMLFSQQQQFLSNTFQNELEAKVCFEDLKDSEDTYKKNI